MSDLERAERVADLALWRADPKFAASVGVERPDWGPTIAPNGELYVEPCDTLWWEFQGEPLPEVKGEDIMSSKIVGERGGALIRQPESWPESAAIVVQDADGDHPFTVDGIVLRVGL